MSRPPLGSTISLFGIEIQWYSLLICLGFVIGIILATREEKRMKLPKDTILNFCLLMIPLALIGARLYYVIFTWNRYANNLLDIFRVWTGGLAIYGGVIGALIAAVIVSKRSKVSFWTLLDACAPSLALGQAIGRWGNYANMEAYGARIYDPAAQFFPVAVEIPVISSNGTVFWYWHMATFFYESVLCVAIYAILWRMRKKRHYQGDIALWYFLLYCAGRTVIEGLRDDSLMLNVSAGQVRFSQVLSALVCIGALVFLFIRLKRNRKLHFADYLAWVITILSVACTFVGEFERNAYPMLFGTAQLLLLAMLVCDIVFLIHYLLRAKRLHAPALFMVGSALLCAVPLLLGLRLAETSTAFVALRQFVGMLHVVLCGAWFYLRCGAPGKPKPTKFSHLSVIENQSAMDQEEAKHAANA